MAVLSGIGTVLLTILKWILKIVLGILRLVLEVAKIFLLLLNLDIVNIGLHFILKNIRPYAASCSEA